MNVAVCTELQVVDVVWVFEYNMREVRGVLRKTSWRRDSWFVFVAKKLGATIKENEMGWACGRYGQEKKRLKSYGEGIWTKESNWKT